MRVTSCLLLLLALSACTGGSGTSVSHARFDARASASLSEIQHGDCAATANAFDATVKSALTPASLCAAFVSYTRQFGVLRATGTPYSTARGQLTVVRIPLTLSHAQGEFRVTYHPAGTIAGIYFLKSGVPLA